MRLSPVERIADYAFLSDCRTAALVSTEGSIDWYCPGRFDAPSVFGRLLDPDAGHWGIRPRGPSDVRRAYEGTGLVLRTEHRTPSGAVSVTDALVQAHGTDGHALGVRAPGVLVRRVEGLEGTVAMETELVARPDYGLASAQVAQREDGDVILQCGPLDMKLAAPVELAVDGARVTGSFRLEAGTVVWFTLSASPAHCELPVVEIDPEGALEATRQAWRAWSDAHQRYRGVARESVARSAAILQGLTYGPSGALLAAATSSVPERVGGKWNWDYRYAWLRDSSLIMRAQWVAACPDEPERFFDWLTRTIGRPGGAPTQIVFGAAGERLLAEQELTWLRGFRDSRPVRAGNGAWDQHQLDVMGEVLDIALLLREQLGDLPDATRAMLIGLADEAAQRWRDPDAGMWEARDRERHYLSSKVMCWVALDRALDLRLAGRAERERWSKERDAIRSAVLDKGWSERAGAFAGAMGSDELDASVLLMPIVGFLGMADERMDSTVGALERSLVSDGLMRRWADDPNGFLLCSYWLVECLALAGESRRAHATFERVTGLANDLGILSEMADLGTSELLGNAPQAFSHAGLINAAWRLTQHEHG